MEPITFLTIFTHLFSYSFNILLLYLISDTKSGIKTKSYISHLIWVELVLNICQHFSVEIIPNLDEKTRMKDVCIFFMSLQMWTVNTIRYVLTFVMALNRFICNVSPRFNKYFDSESIAFFGFGVWMISFIASWYLLLLGCFPRFDPVNFAMDTDCDNLKWSDFIYKSHYLLVLTLLLNISIVIYAKMRRCGFFAVAVARVSSVAASRRSRNEAVFVIQSFIVFFIMGYDVVYSFFRKSYVEEFKGLSRNMQIMLGWLNIYSANYINFLIYFLFHKANRSLVIHTILCTLKWVKTHKVRPTHYTVFGMIWQVVVVAICMHIFVYLFNITLIVMLKSRKVVNSVIYMQHLIASEFLMNIAQSVIAEYPYFFPHHPGWLIYSTDQKEYHASWSVKIFQVLNLLGYQFKFYTAILMAVNRLWVVLVPIGSHVFDKQKLKLYLAAGWILLFLGTLVVMSSPDCYYTMDFSYFQIMPICKNSEQHKLRLLLKDILSYFLYYFLPITSVFINIIVLVRIRNRKTRTNSRKEKGEKRLVMNSLTVSLVITANYLCNGTQLYLNPYIWQQPETVQSFFGFCFFYGVSPFNFLVYFVLDSTTRKRIIATLRSHKSVRPATSIKVTSITTLNVQPARHKKILSF